jgi:hypothetical protein
MGRWTQEGYNAVISAEQHRDKVRRDRELGIATQADLDQAESILQTARVSISSLPQGFIIGTRNGIL